MPITLPSTCEHICEQSCEHLRAHLQALASTLPCICDHCAAHLRAPHMSLNVFHPSSHIKNCNNLEKNLTSLHWIKDNYCAFLLRILCVFTYRNDYSTTVRCVRTYSVLAPVLGTLLASARYSAWYCSQMCSVKYGGPRKVQPKDDKFLSSLDTQLGSSLGRRAGVASGASRIGSRHRAQITDVKTFVVSPEDRFAP